MAFKDTDKGTLRLRKVFADYNATAQMMTPLEQLRADATWKEVYSQETPGIEARARQVLANSEAELRNAEKFLAGERKKAAQRLSESPRLQNAFALAQADYNAALSPEDLARSLEPVKASGDAVLQLAYGKTFKNSESKFAEHAKRLLAHRITMDALEMEQAQVCPPEVINAEARLQTSAEQFAKTRQDIAAVAREFGLTTLAIYVDDAANMNKAAEGIR